MNAETAYNVIQALPSKEVPRLFNMLGIPMPKRAKEVAKKPLITDAQATEYLLRKFKMQWK